ncbi:MAG: hypothetical protein KKE55_07365 [Candidatus Omnitrophica bacterium]|nr:hypothetical protein [Candidatus Omnitrophota bacterium]MBU1524070.1 hypothetical protein [Candidatus Omnitrophota bacterium]MBU2437496.1 hypothetical protein [Candidatus Omnitrophota bacterium]
MQLTERKYINYLGIDCRRRHYHRRIGKWITEFSVQLEIWYRNRWWPILRYDTAHGFAHKDLISASGKVRKTTLDSIQNLSDTLTFALNDIKSNWELYQEQFLKEVENDG